MSNSALAFGLAKECVAILKSSQADNLDHAALNRMFTHLEDLDRYDFIPVTIVCYRIKERLILSIKLQDYHIQIIVNKDQLINLQCNYLEPERTSISFWFDTGHSYQTMGKQYSTWTRKSTADIIKKDFNSFLNDLIKSVIPADIDKSLSN